MPWASLVLEREAELSEPGRPVSIVGRHHFKTDGAVQYHFERWNKGLVQIINGADYDRIRDQVRSFQV